MILEEILEKIVISYRSILNGNLIGIYLHGSAVMQCYNREVSDIDFVVLVKEDPDKLKKRALIEVLLHLSEYGPKKGFEMSIVMEEIARNFIYPTPFLLHYSDLYKERYLQDTSFLCEGGEDTDLAAHFTIIQKRGRCLTGKPISDAFSPIPRSDYIDSILNDIGNAKEDILSSPVYSTLNLCRVLLYLKENIISSKKEGAEWALTILKNPYKETVEKALYAYVNGTEVRIDDTLLVEFALHMLNEIKGQYP